MGSNGCETCARRLWATLPYLESAGRKHENGLALAVRAVRGEKPTRHEVARSRFCETTKEKSIELNQLNQANGYHGHTKTSTSRLC